MLRLKESALGGGTVSKPPRRQVPLAVQPLPGDTCLQTITLTMFCPQNSSFCSKMEIVRQLLCGCFLKLSFSPSDESRTFSSQQHNTQVLLGCLQHPMTSDTPRGYAK